VKIVSLSVLVLVLGIFRHQTFVFHSTSRPLDRIRGRPELIGGRQALGARLLESYNDGGKIQLEGIVTSPAVLSGPKQKLEVKMADGKVLITTNRYPEFHYGDIITFSGRLRSPPEFEEFSYKQYLASKGVYSLSSYPDIEKVGEGGNKLFKAILKLRGRFESTADKIFPEPEVSLLVGTVVGIEREMPKDFNTALKRSGTLHVVVVSGFNITVVILLFMTLLSFFGRKKTLLLSFFGISFYVLLVGFNPPVMRAALMGYIALLGKLFGRQRDALLALLLSGTLILLFSPLSIKSVSFQLSFLATLGIIVLERPLFNTLKAVPGLFKEALSTTCSAMIFVTPILVYNFQAFSLISPLANILIFWTIPVIMGLGSVATLVGMLSLGLGKALGVFAFVPMLFFVKTVEILGGVSLASVSVPQGNWVVWGGYYCLIGLVVLRGNFQELKNGGVQKSEEEY